MAGQEGHLDCTRLLIDSGATVDARRDDGGTPLMFACRYGHEPVAKMLLDKDVLVNKTMASSPDGRHRAGSLTHDLGSTYVKTKERAQKAKEDKPSSSGSSILGMAGWNSYPCGDGILRWRSRGS